MNIYKNTVLFLQINSYIQYKIARFLTHYPMQQFPSGSWFDFCFEIILNDDRMWILDECPDCPLVPCDNILAVRTFQKHKALNQTMFGFTLDMF